MPRLAEGLAASAKVRPLGSRGLRGPFPCSAARQHGVGQHREGPVHRGGAKGAREAEGTSEAWGAASITVHRGRAATTIARIARPAPAASTRIEKATSPLSLSPPPLALSLKISLSLSLSLSLSRSLPFYLSRLSVDSILGIARDRENAQVMCATSSARPSLRSRQSANFPSVERVDWPIFRGFPLSAHEAGTRRGDRDLLKRRLISMKSVASFHSYYSG